MPNVNIWLSDATLKELDNFVKEQRETVNERASRSGISETAIKRFLSSIRPIKRTFVPSEDQQPA